MWSQLPTGTDVGFWFKFNTIGTLGQVIWIFILTHSLLTEPFRQKSSSASAISFTNVTFHVQFSGMVQIIKFLCAYVTKMEKN